MSEHLATAMPLGKNVPLAGFLKKSYADPWKILPRMIERGRKLPVKQRPIHCLDEARHLTEQAATLEGRPAEWTR